MSDNRGNRGRGNYRGGDRGGGDRGDRGGRGGRGGGGRGRGDVPFQGSFTLSHRGGRPDQEGGRGGRGGSNYGDQGGSYQGGGRGGRGGSYRGDQGGSYPGGGGGRGRGGRGRGDGGRKREPEPPSFFSAPNQSPVPDPKTEQLENAIIKVQSEELVQRTKKITKGGKAAARNLFGEHLPARPAFGDQGIASVVYANCFELAVKAITVHKYGLKISKVATVTAAAEQQKGKKGGAKPPSEVRGKKLQFVVKNLLEAIAAMPEPALRDAKVKLEQAKQSLTEAQKTRDKSAIAAAKDLVKKATEAHKALSAAVSNNKYVVSEFKSLVVSVGPLLLTDNPVRVALSEEALEDGAPPRQELFDVELMNPVTVNLLDVTNHVGAMVVDKDDSVFPRHPEAVDVINMILGFQPRSNIDGVAAVGSSRFYPLDNAQMAKLTEDKRPLIAARGFFQSARLATGRLLLNTQVSHGVFKLSGSATGICEELRLRPLRSDQLRHGNLSYLKAISKLLNKIRASVTFRVMSDDAGKREVKRVVKRVKVLEGLVLVSEMTRKRSNKGPNADRFAPNMELCGPAHVSFWNETEKKYVTVKQHFKTTYGLELGDYPLFNFSHGDKSSYFPAELVEIERGQQAKLKLKANETNQMHDFACRPPHANARTLVDESRQCLGHEDNPLLQQLGVSVSPKLLAVQARILNQVQVQYHQERKPRVNSGSWNMREVKVVRSGKSIQKWACLDILSYGNSQPTHSAKLASMVEDSWNKSMGIAINPTWTVQRAFEGDGAIQQMDSFFRECKSLGVQLIIVTLPSKDPGPLYNRIKTLGDCVYGIHTSCMLRKHFDSKWPEGTYANLGLKVNLKFGGVNHKLSNNIDILRDANTMFVGYDVTHPTNMDLPKNGAAPPSLVGLVSSIDSELGQWPSVTWEQGSKQEILGSVLESQFASRIALWQKNNPKKQLDNIVIYRDGVSESQFSTVLTDELPMIRKACEKKFPAGSPSLTIIVSVKRHQTRFYPADEKNLSASSNVRNGTVVDRGVTQVRYWDFYLTAHHAIKGTARPAHYTVLLDEIFRPRYGVRAANELEKLTHELCYLFGRATKAVSICPPAYYADLVCERARAHRPEYAGAEDSASEISGSSGHGPAQTREIHENLRDTMFYI